MWKTEKSVCTQFASQARTLERYRTLIVDDNAYARSAVRRVLGADPRFLVVGEAAGAEEALRAADALRPDLVLMDVRMPGLGGIQATVRLKARFPECRVVMLSVSDDARDLFEAMRGGAQGYLLKNLDPEQWNDYLAQVMSGETPMSRDIATRILRDFAAANPLPRPAVQALTTREEEILRWVATGLTNREIAVRLGIAEGTVKNHLRSVLAKLHVKNRTALAHYAAEKHTPRPRGA